MLRFIVTDYLVPLYFPRGSQCWGCGWSYRRKERYYKRLLAEPPQNYTVAKLKDGTTVRAVFCDFDHGNLLITSRSFASAHRAQKAIDAFFLLLDGSLAYAGGAKLSPIAHVPRATWTPDRFREELGLSSMDPFDAAPREVRSGAIMPKHEMELLGPTVEAVDADDALLEAFSHLGLSRTLVNGSMSGSYYYHHYRHDRRRLDHHQLRREYLENRERYELAFVSSFKAIERFLNSSQIKKHNVANLLLERGCPTILPTTEYQRLHETFLGLPQKLTYEEVIHHFLILRNVVGAHANRNPPKKFCISRDSIFEIQLFVAEMYREALSNVTPRPLPPAGIYDLIPV
jgi:hypothetical protein